jgi:hypothetical protein
VDLWHTALEQLPIPGAGGQCGVDVGVQHALRLIVLV